MAQDTVDFAVSFFKLPAKNKCVTENIYVVGAHGYNANLKIRLIQKFGLDSVVAEHLASSYGDRAFIVADLAKKTGKRWPVVGNRISPAYPYIGISFSTPSPFYFLR